MMTSEVLAIAEDEKDRAPMGALLRAVLRSIGGSIDRQYEE
jgi:hypothetical protein